MRQEAPIGRADVRVAVLPARAAYLVPAGDHRAAVVAIREASTRWAGATEPIVPVRVGGKIDAAWARVVELSNVDGLVNVHLPPALTERAAGQFGLPVVDIDDIDREGRTQFSINPCNLASSEPAGDADSWLWLRRTRACGSESQQATTTRIASTSCPHPRCRLCGRRIRVPRMKSVARRFEVALGWTPGFAISRSTERPASRYRRRWCSG